MRKQLKKLFPGVSWQNPLVNTIFKLIDPVDYALRMTRGLGHLPRYSIRVRSNGINKQFGGRNFHAFGEQLSDYLRTYAGLNEKSRVLEIGCGCGRTAFALAEVLEDGQFVGMDIEAASLASCSRTAVFRSKRFRFDLLDVQNDEYNPHGKFPAHEYVFPYESGEFDVIFLVSVFTHMLTDDVKNYIGEISRMLKPGGVCMVTTFLMDEGRESNGLSFPLNEQEHYFYNPDMPEVAVGYFLDFYESNFAQHGLTLKYAPKLGSWRNDPAIGTTSGFAQDALFFEKN